MRAHSSLSRIITVFLVSAASLGVGCRIAAAAPSMDDPLQWLEDVEGDRALNWVRQQNDRSLGQLTKDARYERFYNAALAIAEDKTRIPLGTLRDGFVYNFWQDDVHVRGLWRRTPLASYRTPNPEWESLLDVDALAKAEGRSWVFKGAVCLAPKGLRCIIQLSDGGKDASIAREFDVPSRTFVKEGFQLPEAKFDLAWQDENTLLVATDWGAKTLTTSGYPYIVKRWSRGKPLASAVEVHRGDVDDVGVSPSSLIDESGRQLIFINEADTFFTGSNWLLGKTGKPVRMTLPAKASIRALHKAEMVFTIEEDWSIGGKTWKSGALLSIPLGEVTKQVPTIRSIMTPGARDSIESVRSSSVGVIVECYANVRGQLRRFSFDKGEWTGTQIPLPDNGAVSLETSEPSSAVAFATYQNFLQPTTLYSVDIAAGKTEPIKSLPPKFDASKYTTEQFEATSRDGTRVPYFVVRSKNLPATGQAPTLLYAYGGFQVSMLPAYSASIGQLWLDQGGVYVLANIRGGGEFGPAWHQAGLKTHRQVVYDDFIGVAEDLIRRGITSSRRLGIEGGSNGGLLMGVMLTQRPDLFRAVVVQVPLLDMLRYNQLLAGASWVDEYGSPDVPAEREWLEKFSPYQNLRKRPDFPMPFLLTSTKDDRVHPGHARKYAAKLESLGMPFLYYENIEGGHSAAANLRERARRQALEFTYLSERLVD